MILCPRYPAPRLLVVHCAPPKAIEDNILEWVSLLHIRTPLCTVMLVASHYDMLHGAPEENKELLLTVEQRCVPSKPVYGLDAKNDNLSNPSHLIFIVWVSRLPTPPTGIGRVSVVVQSPSQEKCLSADVA